MNKYQEFIQFVDYLISQNSNSPPMTENVLEVYNFIKNQGEIQSNKPEFTEIGLLIIKYMKSCGKNNLKAKDIADGLEISSRQISGAIRKLVADKYVSKIGQNPVIYNLTEKGINFNFEEQGENNNGEKESY